MPPAISYCLGDGKSLFALVPLDIWIPGTLSMTLDVQCLESTALSAYSVTQLRSCSV